MRAKLHKFRYLQAKRHKFRRRPALHRFTPLHRFLRDKAQLNLNDQRFKSCKKYFKFCLSAARLVFAPCPGYSVKSPFICKILCKDSLICSPLEKGKSHLPIEPLNITSPLKTTPPTSIIQLPGVCPAKRLNLIAARARTS